MNANELAEALEDWDNDGQWDEAAATMLRQQQTEIESLKLQLHTTLTNRDLRTYDGKLDINNEPVAWMYQIHDITGWTWVIDQRLPNYEYRNEKPLYTHPAKTLTDAEKDACFNIGYKEGAKDILNKPAKTLTDEEIAQAWAETKGDILHRLMPFARAILRKAQEK